VAQYRHYRSVSKLSYRFKRDVATLQSNVSIQSYIQEVSGSVHTVATDIKNEFVGILLAAVQPTVCTSRVSNMPPTVGNLEHNIDAVSQVFLQALSESWGPSAI
jgi:hypothetical protein